MQNGCHFADDIFKCIVLNENFWILSSIIEICSLGFNWHVIIGSDNSLLLNRGQAIIWTNDGLVYWRI